jgi:hypothetical protein
MSGSSHRASGPAEKPRQKPTFTLSTARAMLPLVRRIVGDVVQAQSDINRRQPELENLQRHRRDLSWPERQRRYRLEDETHQAQRHLTEATGELDQLGIRLLDAASGEIGFPTSVNGKEAFYCWTPDEDGVQSWRYAAETDRRPLPPEGVGGSSSGYRNKH